MGSSRVAVRPYRAALAAAAAIALASATSALGVVGGSAAPAGAYAYTASVQDPSGFAFCGGSVISRTWVLTAAHCVSDDPSAPLYVVTGRTNLSDSSTGQRIAVKRTLVHPAYADSTHDVALLELAEATTSPPVALAGAADDALEAAGTPVVVSGWGDQTPTFGLNSTDRMRYADLQVVDDADCGTNLGFDAATGVCAEALLKDSCQGDSGGPLVATAGGRKVQIGVVSYGTSCAVPFFPGVYSEVNNPAIRGWIRSTSGV